MDRQTRMIFYFDIDDPAVVSNLVKNVKKIGGEYTSFFSKDVTHFVTNRTIPGKQGELTLTSLPMHGNNTSNRNALNTPSSSVPIANNSMTGQRYMTSLGSQMQQSAIYSRLSSSAVPFDRLVASPITPSSALHHQLHHQYDRSLMTPLSTISNNMGKENMSCSSQLKENKYLNLIKTNDSVDKYRKANGGLETAVCTPTTMWNHSQSQYNDLITKARAYNIFILSLEQFIHYLIKEWRVSPEELLVAKSIIANSNTAKKRIRDMDLLNCLIADKRQQNGGGNITPITNGSRQVGSNNTCQSAQAFKGSNAEMSQWKEFEFPFVLIEDIDHLYRPIFKEFRPSKSGKSPEVPRLYLDAPTGQCPFQRPPVNHVSISTGKKLSSKQQQISTNHPMLVRESLKYKMANKMKIHHAKRPGYCECCLEKYADIEEHVLLPSHRKFASNNEHYAALDILLASLVRPIASTIHPNISVFNNRKKRRLIPPPAPVLLTPEPQNNLLCHLETKQTANTRHEEGNKIYDQNMELVDSSINNNSNSVLNNLSCPDSPLQRFNRSQKLISEIRILEMDNGNVNISNKNGLRPLLFTAERTSNESRLGLESFGEDDHNFAFVEENEKEGQSEAALSSVFDNPNHHSNFSTKNRNSSVIPNSNLYSSPKNTLKITSRSSCSSNTLSIKYLYKPIGALQLESSLSSKEKQQSSSMIAQSTTSRGVSSNLKKYYFDDKENSPLINTPSFSSKFLRKSPTYAVSLSNSPNQKHHKDIFNFDPNENDGINLIEVFSSPRNRRKKNPTIV